MCTCEGHANAHVCTKHPHKKWPKTPNSRHQFLTKYRCDTLKQHLTKHPVFASTLNWQVKGKKHTRTLFVTKGCVNHELSPPREHHHGFTRCQTQIQQMRHTKSIFHCSRPSRSQCSPLIPCCFAVRSPRRFGWEETQPTSSWWGCCPTRRTRSPSSPCTESQPASRSPSRESPVCSHRIIASRHLCSTHGHFLKLAGPNVDWWYMMSSVPRSVPLPPAGELRVRDITHSTMRLHWDAAPGAVRKYLITYKPEDGDAKEVSLLPVPLHLCSYFENPMTRQLYVR